MLDPNVFRTITKYSGGPSIDLFASRLNAQLTLYASWQPDHYDSAKFINALSINWRQI